MNNNTKDKEDLTYSELI